MAELRVTVPDEMVELVDAEARRRSSTRSAFLLLAVNRELARRDTAAIDAAMERGRELFRDAGPFDAGELIREERDRRDLRDMYR